MHEICKCLNKYQTSFNRNFIPFLSKFARSQVFCLWEPPQMTKPIYTVEKNLKYLKLH